MPAPAVDLSKLIIDASNYKVAMNMSVVPGGPGTVFVFQTLSSIGWNVSAENEVFYAVGNKWPIGIDNNAYKMSGKMTMQAGELFSLQKIFGVASLVFSPSSILGVVALDGTFSKTFSGVMYHTDAIDIKNKDKESLVSMDWAAILVS
jgi:hypothetical protein